MKSRYTPLLIILAVLAITAAVGYTLPTEAQDVPPRVILDNTGGRVIFTHQAHTEEYGFDCADCHHDGIGQDEPISCGSCHPAAFDETFRAEHQKAFPDEEACLRCHYDVPGEELAEDNRPDTDFIPTRADAFHGQCMTCHEEFGGPYGDDTCYDCHAE
ncbi:cytochrome c3 family protein [Salidesulfovibrio brasiliensis]|uniref:cytochrome c3 family protein n=1 Tax=Salidesulfovibrio brasiliensis TaxID=221711 RepID=UPI0006D103B9|nr:cytochrome c3 family protein [Salidesulfovibrio brasiliensis]